MNKKIGAGITAGFGFLIMFSGCVSSKQVISGYEDPVPRTQTESVGKPGDPKEETEKMEALIRKMEETERRLIETERKNRETLRRLEEASKKTERAMERIEKAGEKIEAVGKKAAP